VSTQIEDLSGAALGCKGAGARDKGKSFRWRVQIIFGVLKIGGQFVGKRIDLLLFHKRFHLHVLLRVGKPSACSQSVSRSVPEKGSSGGAGPASTAREPSWGCRRRTRRRKAP